MLRRVALVKTDVSEELSATFIRATRTGELGTTLAVTSNRCDTVSTTVVSFRPRPLYPRYPVERKMGVSHSQFGHWRGEKSFESVRDRKPAVQPVTRHYLGSENTAVQNKLANADKLCKPSG
jgi:hypothetical protein